MFAEPNEPEEDKGEPEPTIEKQKSVDRAGKLYLPEPLARANRSDYRQALLLEQDFACLYCGLSGNLDSWMCFRGQLAPFPSFDISCRAHQFLLEAKMGIAQAA